MSRSLLLFACTIACVSPASAQISKTSPMLEPELGVNTLTDRDFFGNPIDYGIRLYEYEVWVAEPVPEVIWVLQIRDTSDENSRWVTFETAENLEDLIPGAVFDGNPDIDTRLTWFYPEPYFVLFDVVTTQWEADLLVEFWLDAGMLAYSAKRRTVFFEK